MAVKIGARDVIVSGSVISETGLSVAVPVDDLLINFEFETDATSDSAQVKLRGGGEKSLTVELVNFKNALGLAYDQKIGEMSNRPLIMALYVQTLGQERKTHLLHYTFSVGDREDV